MLIILVKLIGIYVAVMGVIFLLRPKSLKGYTAFWEQGKRLYLIGGSRIVLGAILLWASPVCRLKTIVFVLGIFMIFFGLPYFFLNMERLKIMVSRWQTRSALSVRLLGLAILAAGVLLIYSI